MSNGGRLSFCGNCWDISKREVSGILRAAAPPRGPIIDLSAKLSLSPGSADMRAKTAGEQNERNSHDDLLDSLDSRSRGTDGGNHGRNSGRFNLSAQPRPATAPVSYPQAGKVLGRPMPQIPGIAWEGKNRKTARVGRRPTIYCQWIGDDPRAGQGRNRGRQIGQFNPDEILSGLDQMSEPERTNYILATVERWKREKGIDNA